MTYEGCEAAQHTAQVTAEHQVQYKETIHVILERIPDVDQERMVDLRTINR